ncbi:ParB/RepB/Spo0J family partition protein [Amycolatopsis sp. A133]|uniref:ParB/RepB/Spo0J family partition protein n=1 Tax=Amycolatopsis sp. A133 TaxID=3064472 RepID=UPI0027FC5125|nr:ParB/RepB/Spo0J family partition protein [Amycolatopsis sp. A133]MDQ7803481.1 ParB/RepB/Spo0J family partition protein [Amycolatopsis sp. A133]
MTVRESPRQAGEDQGHVRYLAECSDPLPPILVHRQTMVVVDGLHRLRAAELRGARTIAVRFISCPPSEIFVEAVRANINHGLPLSFADRKAAAARIVASHPHWSDRAIAATSGLSHKTVGKIRQAFPGNLADTPFRVGQDGHVRPPRGYGRAVAEEIIRRHPHASLRQVAAAARISVSTAHAVRRRLSLDADQAPPPRRSEENRHDPADRPAPATADSAADLDVAPPAPPTRRAPAETEDVARHGRMTAVIGRLRADPSLRFTDAGRALLHLLSSYHPTKHEWHQLVRSVPAHWAPTVADLAREVAAGWQAFAGQLDEVNRRENLAPN